LSRLLVGWLALVALGGALAPSSADAADPAPVWAVWPRAQFAGGGLGVSVTHRPSRVHFDLTTDVRFATLGAPQVSQAPPGLGMFPFVRVRPRFAVGLPNKGSLEVRADVAILAAPGANPVVLDPSVLAPWLRAHVGLLGSPEPGLRMSVQGAVDVLGADSSGALSTPHVLGGGRARVTFAKWMGTGLPLPKTQDFVLSDPEGPAPLDPTIAPLVLLFADTTPPGGVFLDAWVDAQGGEVGGRSFAGAGIWPVVPRLRAEIVASLPLPIPIPAPFPVLGALEFQGIAGVVPTRAPAPILHAYPGALTRDPRAFRGETLLKARFALRMPIGPPPPPAAPLLLFGAPTLQIDVGLGDVWGYVSRGGAPERTLPGVDDGVTGPTAGEVGVEFRLPMAWTSVVWTLWVRGEVGLRSGVGAVAPTGAPWLGGAGPPVGFAVGLGVPVR